MSLPVTMYRCTHCDFVQGNVGTRGAQEYVLDDGVHIPLHWHMGWCESCHGLSAIENLSSQIRFHEYRKAQGQLQIVARRLGGLQFGLSKDDRSKVRRYEDQLEDAIDELEMLSKRKSAAHCLRCLSTQVQTMGIRSNDSDNEPNSLCEFSASAKSARIETVPKGNSDKSIWLHPGCGGEIYTMEHPDGLRLAMRPTIHRFTSEGMLIETEYVQGYSVPDEEYCELLSATNRNLRALRFSTLEESGLLDIPKFLRNCAD